LEHSATQGCSPSGPPRRSTSNSAPAMTSDKCGGDDWPGAGVERVVAGLVVRVVVGVSGEGAAPYSGPAPGQDILTLRRTSQ
jgi:hypothetical protein